MMTQFFPNVFISYYLGALLHKKKDVQGSKKEPLTIQHQKSLQVFLLSSCYSVFAIEFGKNFNNYLCLGSSFFYYTIPAASKNPTN